MEEDLHSCNMRFISISVTVVLSFVALIIGRIALKKVPGITKVFRQFMPHPHTIMIDLHREVGELRRATLQIAKDWGEMTKLMTVVKEQQCSFVRRLEGDFQAMGDCLHKSLQVSMQEECLKNHQRFTHINKTVDSFRDDFQSLREMLRKHGNLLEKDRERPPMVDGWTQTERELIVKRRPREGHPKMLEEIGIEHEASKSVISIIKKALAEFLKEAKKHLSHEKEEMAENMKLIFTQLSEDREDIKNAIVSAFSTATHQTQQNLEQVGCLGHDAFKCLLVLSEKSEKIANARFHEHAEKLRDIMQMLQNLNFDVGSVKTILDNIDCQFDDIYKKLEFGHQSNDEHYEDVANKLKKVMDDWNEKYSHLEATSRQLTGVTEKLKDLLCVFNKAGVNKTTARMDMQAYSQTTLKPGGDATLIDNLGSEDTVTLVEHYSVSEDLPTLLRVCYVKINSLNNIIEQGSNKINESIDNLLKNIHFLSSSVESSVEKLKNLSIDLPKGEKSQKFNQELKEFIKDMVNLSSKKAESPPPSFKIRESNIMDERPPWTPKAESPNKYAKVANPRTSLKTKGNRDLNRKAESRTDDADDSVQTSIVTIGDFDDLPKTSKD